MMMRCHQFLNLCCRLLPACSASPAQEEKKVPPVKQAAAQGQDKHPKMRKRRGFLERYVDTSPLWLPLICLTPPGQTGEKNPVPSHSQSRLPLLYHCFWSRAPSVIQPEIYCLNLNVDDARLYAIRWIMLAKKCFSEAVTLFLSLFA